MPHEITCYRVADQEAIMIALIKPRAVENAVSKYNSYRYIINFFIKINKNKEVDQKGKQTYATVVIKNH